MHVPRTGGTSLEEASRVEATSHATLLDRHRLLQAVCNGTTASDDTDWRTARKWQCEKRPHSNNRNAPHWINDSSATLLAAVPTFAVVRNPFERAVSMWGAQQCHSFGRERKSGPRCGGLLPSAFKEWVLNLSHGWRALWLVNPWWFRPQASYVLDGNLTCAVDYLLLFERLRESYALLRQRHPDLGALSATPLGGIHLEGEDQAQSFAQETQPSSGGSLASWRGPQLNGRLTATVANSSWCRYYLNDQGETAELVKRIYRVDFQLCVAAGDSNIWYLCQKRDSNRVRSLPRRAVLLRSTRPTFHITVAGALLSLLAPSVLETAAAK